MRCESCATQDRPVDRLATATVWCPTWVSAHKGPMHLCEQHRDNFDEAINPNAAGGSFHFGNAAYIAFEAVECFIQRQDERYQNAKRMIENGSIVMGHRIGLFDWIVSIVDGKVWIGTYQHISRLGNIEQAKQLFPALFAPVRELVS